MKARNFPKSCTACHAPFFFHTDIGTTSISVDKGRSCGSLSVQPMADVIHRLTAIRELEAAAC